MGEGKNFFVIRKLLKALGLSEEAVDDIIQWIDGLANREKRQEQRRSVLGLHQFPEMPNGFAI